jgi:hypothetical protein
MKTFELLQEFMSIIDSIYGVYLDSTMGFHLIGSQQLVTQLQSVARLRETNPELASTEYLDSCAMIFGRGNPNNPDAVELHRCTQGEHKSRNEKGGKNYSFIANMCLASIYQYWEDHYREELATSVGKSKNEIMSPIMGDIRRLRVSIIHNNGIAISDIEKCEILMWFKHGEAITLDQHQFETVILEIKKFLWEWMGRLEVEVESGK